MKFVTATISHEVNVFNPLKADLEYIRKSGLRFGDDVTEFHTGTKDCG